MKNPILLLTTFLLTSAAFAADLRLIDGRVLKDATIVSQTPRAVTIKHSSGLSSVAKSQLPADLRAKYPVDESAALVADQRAAEAKIAAQGFQQREIARAANAKTNRDLPNETSAPAPVASAHDPALQVTTKALPLVTAYFEKNYPRFGSDTLVTASIQAAIPIETLPGQWRIRGRAYISRKLPEDAKPDESQVGDPNWRNQYNNNQPDQQVRINSATSPQIPDKRNNDRYSSQTIETKQFEGIYSEADEKPTVRIHVR